MSRNLSLLGAPSALGLRPYDAGGARRLDLTPASLRAQDLARRLGAGDRGDVRPESAYLDLDKPENRCRNEDAVRSYSHQLAAAVRDAVLADEFIVLLGGDCSIMLGAVAGLRDAVSNPVGLIYIDAHADFATLAESPSHSPCSMNLALGVGRASGPLACLRSDGPLVRGPDVVHIGRRDDHHPEYGCRSLAEHGILDLSEPEMSARGLSSTVETALGRVAGSGSGFWIHFDVDVLDPRVMPAVDSPLPRGIDFAQAAELLRPLVRHPLALGLQLTIYDPTIDTTGLGAERLAQMLELALVAA